MKGLAWSGAITALLITAAPWPAAAQSEDKIVLKSDGHTAEIPVEGLKANEEAIDLARQIADSQKALSEWRSTADTSDPQVRKMVKLVTTLQGDSIEQLDTGYKTAITTSGGFPGEKKSDIQVLLGLVSGIMARAPQFQDKVFTHISTTVPDSVIHYRKYSASTNQWSTYTNGQSMDTGAYYFKVSRGPATVFQERVVVIDNPHSQQIEP